MIGEIVRGREYQHTDGSRSRVTLIHTDGAVEFVQVGECGHYTGGDPGDVFTYEAETFRRTHTEAPAPAPALALSAEQLAEFVRRVRGAMGQPTTASGRKDAWDLGFDSGASQTLAILSEVSGTAVAL